jgi:cytosine/adenosine deaminase-related metal-dependent hydrolase
MNKFLNLVMRYITADQIFSGKGFFAPATVLVLDEKSTIHDIITTNEVEKSNIEHFKGIITPGFINTHCHLELSHLKNVINQHTGIVDFGLNVIKHRNDVSPEDQLKAMLEADKDMWKQGIVAVGDISNTNASIAAKKKSALYYHTFVELIALNPERAQQVFEAGKIVSDDFQKNNLSVSLAAHAPYSTSLQLIRQIMEYCHSGKKPTSIHNQESKAENEFFLSKTGDYLRLYESLNIPIDYFEAPHKSSLQTIAPALHKKVNTLLVHNTFTHKDDIEFVQKTHSDLYWCLCPNANLYIENTLPNIDLLQTMNCELTIGTDSLASNCKLSIIDEINTIIKYQPTIKTETLLKAATFNGAQFLGIDNKFGLLEKNRAGEFNLVEGDAGNYTVKKLPDINRRG